MTAKQVRTAAEIRSERASQKAEMVAWATRPATKAEMVAWAIARVAAK